MNDQIKSEITQTWHLREDGHSAAEIAETLLSSVGHVRRRLRFKADYDRGDVLRLGADESRKKYGNSDLLG